MIPIALSDRYLAMTAPPATAIPVAMAWAAIAPPATLTGFWAADRAIVERKDRSPNSAANTRPKILKIRALFRGKHDGCIRQRKIRNKKWQVLETWILCSGVLEDTNKQIYETTYIDDPCLTVSLSSTASSASANSSSMTLSPSSISSASFNVL